MKRIAIPVVIISVVLMMILSGCSYMLSSPDELLEPPKLDYEQSKIFEALEQSVGKNIALKYPKTGEYRSAFIRYDIDGDEFDEAIVFYHSLNVQTGQPLTHIKLLDYSNDKWEAICDIGGEAMDIDRLTFADFDGKVRMIVGWELISNKEKTLMVYKLENRLFSREYSDTYVEFVVDDFNNDGFDELVTINQSAENALQNVNILSSHSARLLTVLEGKIQVVSTTQLDSTVMGYSSCAVGKVNDYQKGIFVDGIKGANTLNTQIILADKNNILSNPLLSVQQLSLTERKSMIPSKDIDGNGIVEVPKIQVMPGYEDMSDADKMWITGWQRLEQNKLVTKMDTIISGTYGFVFTIPDKWKDKVTVKRSLENEFIFVEYKGSLEESVDELFRLRITSKSKYLGEPENYFKITENNTYVYSAVIAERVSEDVGNLLRLDKNDIMYYLTVN